MKILIIQENGRRPENINFRECYNLKRSFDRIGVQSEIWGLGHKNFEIDFNSLVKNYDVLFVLENYDETNWIPNLSNLPNFKVFWSIDSHCNPLKHIDTVKKHKIDLTLNSIESDQKLFNNTITRYFPNAYPSDLIFPISDINKKNFIGFCGSPFQYRVDAINLIEEKLKIKFQKDFWVLGNEMVKTINGYQIHFNKSENDDINYRVFETLGTKTLLITSKNENIDRFFTDMVDIVLYENDQEMLDKLNYLIKNQNLINQIANNGYEKVIKNHSYDVRVKDFIQILENFL